MPPGSRHGLPPVRVALLAVDGRHSGFEAIPLERQCGKLRLRGPETYRQSGEVGGAESGDLGGGGPQHRAAENVRLELHELIVAGRPAVGQQNLELNAGLGPHEVVNVANLVGDGGQGGVGQMRRAAASSQPADQAARGIVPVWRSQPNEGRYEVGPAAVFNACRQLGHSSGRIRQSEQLAQPLHGGAGRQDVAFESEGGPLAVGPGHGG